MHDSVSWMVASPDFTGMMMLKTKYLVKLYYALSQP